MDQDEFRSLFGCVEGVDVHGTSKLAHEMDSTHLGNEIEASRTSATGAMTRQSVLCRHHTKRRRLMVEIEVVSKDFLSLHTFDQTPFFPGQRPYFFDFH